MFLRYCNYPGKSVPCYIAEPGYYFGGFRVTLDYIFEITKEGKTLYYFDYDEDDEANPGVGESFETLEMAMTRVEEKVLEALLPSQEYLQWITPEGTQSYRATLKDDTVIDIWPRQGDLCQVYFNGWFCKEIPPLPLEEAKKAAKKIVLRDALERLSELGVL